MRKIFLLLSVSLITIGAFSQDFSNKGKDFWVGYGYHQVMNAGNAQNMVLYFATDQVTNITITIPGIGYTQTLTSPAGSNVLTSAIIPKGTTGTGDARLFIEGVSDKGIHVTSDRPMVAYAHVYNSSVSGATILYPTNTLGKEYYSVNYKNWSNSANSNCWFYVVAVDPGTTTIQVTPTGNTTGGWVAGNTYTVNLTQGQVYNVMGSLLLSPNNCNPVCTGYDLTGSVVKSISSGSGGCKKIAVFSGSGRISISCDNSSSSSDNYMVQSVPKTAWGKKYLTIPAASNQGYNFYRVCVSDPTTVVSINGAVTGLPLQGNFYYEIAATNQPQLIEADKPVTVAQYFTSQGECGNGNPGDPEVIYLSAVEQNINSVLWNATSNFAINAHYYNVVIPNKGTGISSFTLDGAPVSGWVVHPQDVNYSYLKMAVTGGLPHLIKSDSGFNAIAYGFGSAESYGYNAGTNIKDLYQQIGVNTEYGIESTPSVCTNTPFRFKVSLPYCADSIRWNLNNLPGPPVAPATSIYTTCTPGVIGGPDSTSIVNGKTIYWYSLPSLYSFSTIGTYPVTITTFFPTAECGGTQDIDFDLTISSPPLPSYAVVTPGCYMERAEFIETTVQTPKPTYKWFWDFGDGNTSTLKNPSHTYAAPGTYITRYSSITTPGCLSDTISQTIVIPDVPSATIGGSNTVCINTGVENITFTASNGRPPYQFSYNINGGGAQTVSSTGTNTSVTIPVSTTTAGTFIYTLDSVKNVGSTVCTKTIAGQSATIIVNPDASITLTSAPATNNQTLCINTPITDITYAVAGGGSGAGVTGLPAGLTGTYAAGVFTITGTPTVSGTFNYTVTTTGICIQKTATGSITVNPDAAIALSSPSGSDAQSLCINTLLNNITYAVSGGGTGATVSGLPAGITGSYSSGVFTIAGSPTVAGTFNYTVTTTGICIQKTATGTITVNPDAAIALTSAPATANQTLCINTAIANITYAVSGGGTGGVITGLPAGVTGIYAAGNVLISGTPTVSGTFNYTVATTGTCVQTTATGTIIINPDAAIALTSAPATTNQELCATASITPISYSITGGGTGATVTGLPAGVSGMYSAGVFTITGTPTVSGVYNYTVTTTGICIQKTATGTITVDALPTPDFTYTMPSCETRVITFTDASTANTGALNNWQWTFGDATSGTGTPVTKIYTAAGTYTVTLTVSTDKGCVSNPIASKTVVINDRPLAGYIIPEVCLSDTYAQFTDTSKVANGNITAWAWNFGDPNATVPNPNTSIVQNPQHSYTGVGTYPVQLIATSNTGCKDTISQNLIINGSFPVANFTVNNPATLCANDSVAIVNASTVFPGTITKVEIYWDNVNFPGVFQLDDLPYSGKVYRHLYPNFQSPLTKTFTIRFRAYSGGVCVNDKISTITVNAAPKVQFNTMPDACFDAAPFQITQAGEIGGVPGTGVYTGAGVSPTGIFNPAAAGIGLHFIKYTYTSTAAGCVDTITRAIKVLDTASAQFTFITPTCEGSTTTFKDESLAPAGVTLNNIICDFGDGSPLASYTPGSTFTHTYATAGTYTVKLYTTSAYGCKSTTRSRQILISPIPNAAFAFKESSVCIPNASVSFINNSTIADGSEAGFLYLWNFGDIASGTLNTSLAKTPPAHLYSGTGPYTVTLTVTSDSGCVKTVNKPVDFIHPQPVTSFTMSKPGVCIGDPVTFTDISNGLDGTVTQWYWDFGDGVKAGTSPVSYLYKDTLLYNVSLYIVNSHGCSSDPVTQPFTVYPYPAFDAGPDQVVLEGGSTTLPPNIIRGTSLQYLWTPATYLNDNTAAIPTASNMLDDITYTLQVTGRGGCVAPTDKVFVKILKAPQVPNTFTPNGDGINELWKIEYLDTYPDCRVQVFTRNGQLVFESKGYKTPWNGTIKGKALPFDTYYYIIEPGNGRKPITGYVTIMK